MDACNGWYHVNGSTYGTWLPGDPRGWRTKHHRKHVEGDYRHPPTRGSGDELHEKSRHQLKRTPVCLASTEFEIAGQAVVEMLVYQQVEVIIFSLDGVHFHLLANRDKQVRPRVARAKRHATFLFRDRGHAGKLWGRKGKVTPITDRQHQLNVFNYIARHADQGAWLWTFREGLYWPSTIQTKKEPPHSQQKPPHRMRGRQ